MIFRSIFQVISVEKLEYYAQLKITEFQPKKTAFLTQYPTKLVLRACNE